MQKAPTIVLICGVFTAVIGTALILFGRRVDGLLGFAIPIALLGLSLIAIWVRSARRPAGPVNEFGIPEQPLPGPWYPFALLSVPLLLVVWLKVWPLL